MGSKVIDAGGVDFSVAGVLAANAAGPGAVMPFATLASTLGVVDAWTKTESDARYAAIVHGHSMGDISGLVASLVALDASITSLGSTKADKATTLTINGVAQDLSANRSWSIDFSPYVPYTGATGAVNLGSQSLSAGAITASGTVIAATKILFSGTTSTECGVINATGTRLIWGRNSTSAALITQSLNENAGGSGFTFRRGEGLSWSGSTTSSEGGGQTAFFFSEAANTYNFRNGLNAQSIELDNTYTSSTTREFIRVRGVAGANFEFGPSNGSIGGTLRGLTIGGYVNGSTTITPWLSFTNAGAATFVGALNAGGDISIGSAFGPVLSTQGGFHSYLSAYRDVGGASLYLRSSTGGTDKVVTLSAGGLCIRNYADSADAALTAGAITASSVSSPILTAAAGQAIGLRAGASGSNHVTIATTGTVTFAQTIYTPAFYGMVMGNDVFFARDVASTLELRNSTTAIDFRISGTYTSSTSNEFIRLRGVSGANFEIGPSNGSAGGTLRGLTIGGYTNGSSTITPWLTLANTGAATFANSVTASQYNATAGTITSSTPGLNLTQTWNSGATTFTGALINVTDTASSASSLLADFQVGGTSKLKIGKDGTITFNTYSYLTPAIIQGAWGVSVGGNNLYCGLIQSLTYLLSDYGSIKFGSSAGGPWLNNTYGTHCLNQRNGTNAQTFRVANTFVSDTNFEYGNLGWSSNEFRIGVSVGNAGGTQRNLILGAWDSASAWTSKVVITPTASGAFYLGPVADGTTTGGNARGSYAVDLSGGRSIASYVASGSYSFAAGYGCAATQSYSISIGNANASGGIASVALGDNVEILNANYSVATGSWSQAVVQGQRSHASGSFSFNRGTAQICDLVLRNSTSNATATTLYLNGSSSRPTVQSGRAWDFLVKVVGIKSDGSKMARFWRQGLIKNVGGTTSLVGLQTVGTDYEDDAGTDIAITADDTNDALQIQVTGIAAESWRWVAHIWYEEIAYG